MAKLTRKNIIDIILNNDSILKIISENGNCDFSEAKTIIEKWQAALTKTSTSNNKTKSANDDIIVNEIVPFILENKNPVTAKTINEKFIHAERTNKASAILRRAIELGLISRDRVRKNANFEYASPTFDWSAYINEYDKKVAAKAAARIENARKNRK